MTLTSLLPKSFTTTSRGITCMTVSSLDAGFGAPETSRGERHAPASSRGITRLVVLVLSVATTAVLGVCAGPAFAVSHVFSTTFGSSGSGAGQLSGPQGVAVDNATGDVYVADRGNQRVVKFDATGNFILTFGKGVDQTTGGDVCTAASGDTCQAGTQDARGNGAFFDPTFVAVDNSNGASAGDVYVGSPIQYGRPFISKFSSAGGFLFDNNGSGTLYGWTGNAQGLTSIAVDPHGHLWARDDNLYEFAEGGAFLQQLQSGNGNAFAGQGEGGLAVDNIHIFNGLNNEPLVRYSISGQFQGTLSRGAQPLGGGPNSARDLTLDPATEDLYVIPINGDVVQHYNASCIPVTGPQIGDQAGCSVSDTFASSHLTHATGLALDTESSRLYVADGPTDHVAVFVPPPAGAPVIANQWTSSAGSINATVKAAINAMRNDTSCQLQYVDAVAFSASGFSGAGSVPCDPADIGARFADQPVSVLITGLAPGTTYHYRFVASSSAGSDHGADRTFSTEIPEVNLPDDRAYEQVSPVDKDSNGVVQANPTVASSYQASVDGNRMSFLSFNPFAGSVAPGSSVLATRGTAAWSTVSQIPPQSQGSTLCTFFLSVAANSSDLSKSILPDGYNQANNCGADDPELVPGEPRGVGNVFLRDNATGAYQLVSLNPVIGPPADAFLVAEDPSLSHVVFHEAAQLTADAPSGVDNLYDWSGGSVKLVAIAPDGTPMASGGSMAGGALGTARHAISDDGSKLFFQGGDGNLYARVGGTHTVQVDASQGSGPGGGGTFLFATPDGASVFFTDADSAGITDDTVAGSGQNLYRYDFSNHALTDLTPAADVGVLGLSGAGDSGADVYFVATGDLDGGATPGQPNLYHWRGGATTFIGTLSSDYPNNCVWTAGFLCARVTPDGQHLAFNTDQSLTSTDTGGFTEVYLYEAGSGHLICASCHPGGASANGSAIIQNAPFLGANQETLVLSRELSADGSRLFFTADGPLVARDTNEQPDVYEYEGGKLHLISSGTAPTPTRFLDASANGDDVFIETAQRLVSSDIDGSLDIYDVRVGGGFPVPPVQTPCSGDVCKGAGSGAPGVPVAGTVSFGGPGDAAPGSGRSASGKVSVLSRSVRGPSFVVKVRVPAKGRVTVTGRGVKSIKRSLGKAGTYSVKVSLTPAARSTLRHKRKLKLALRVGYTPASGSASSTSVSLTVKA
jgi:hypothetical protein